mmetsp:Transcript_118620/g.193130  ORF Transcript_118620/g.193130 Transcript_118620/m.193130 type:complete len:204 (+) Transcript_118620:137-748(+)
MALPIGILGTSALLLLFAVTGTEAFRRRWQNVQEVMDLLGGMPQVGQHPKATEDHFRTSLLSHMGARPGTACVESGATAEMGCALGCHCSWEQQCYPRSVLVDEVAGQSFKDAWVHNPLAGDKVNVGVCALSIPSLMCGSVLVFISALLTVVILRLALLGSCCGEKDLVDEYGFPIQMPPAPHKPDLAKAEVFPSPDPVEADN